MTVEAFRREHLEALTLQPAQAAWMGVVTPEQARILEENGESWSLFLDGRIVGCGGTLDLGGGRAEAWALLDHHARTGMLAATRAVRRFFDVSPYRRIEAVTKASFEPGAKWAKMLGFCFEGSMAAYCDDGSDALRWALVKR